MSRALDKGVKEALKNGDHEKVFWSISSALCKEHDDLLEMELLPASHQLPDGTSLLQDGNALAVPKFQLVQAFLVARKKLSTKTSLQESKWRSDIEASNVMLLMDPEHLTAANIRKRIIGDAYDIDQAEAKALLLQEKYFIDSLLTSRLHRHTKSPVLWSHRRWLMGRFIKAGLGVDVVRDLRRVIFISAERHPRNYYAWCHARLLVDMSGCVEPHQLSVLVDDTKKWCFSHHNDISGWEFLQFLLKRCDAELVLDVFSATMKRAASFSWRNESVWIFLRAMATWEVMPQSGRTELREVMSLLRPVQTEAEAARNAERVLDQAARWMELYEPASG
jgi:protein prenyltransferase alpha subunit repeat containing protein 1